MFTKWLPPPPRPLPPSLSLGSDWPNPWHSKHQAQLSALQNCSTFPKTAAAASWTQQPIIIDWDEGKSTQTELFVTKTETALIGRELSPMSDCDQCVLSSPTIVDLFIERIVFLSDTRHAGWSRWWHDKLEKALRPLFWQETGFANPPQQMETVYKAYYCALKKEKASFWNPPAWPSNILILSLYWWCEHKRVLWSSISDQLPAIRHPQYLTRAALLSTDADHRSHNREKWAKMTLKFCHDIDMYYCLASSAGDGHNISALGESLALVNRNSWLSTSQSTSINIL